MRSEIAKHRLESLKNFQIIRETFDLKIEEIRVETSTNFELIKKELSKINLEMAKNLDIVKEETRLEIAKGADIQLVRRIKTTGT